MMIHRWVSLIVLIATFVLGFWLMNYGGQQLADVYGDYTWPVGPYSLGTLSGGLLVYASMKILALAHAWPRRRNQATPSPQ